MARVRIDNIIDYLSQEMESALADATQRTMPGTEFRRNELFRAFKDAVGQKCGWERVPDSYVEMDE